MGQDDRQLEAPARYAAPGASIPACCVRQGGSLTLVAVNLPSNCSGMPAPSNRPLAGHWMSLIYPVSLSAPNFLF